MANEEGRAHPLIVLALADMICGVKVVLLDVACTKLCLDSTFLWDAIQGDSPVYRTCVV